MIRTAKAVKHWSSLQLASRGFHVSARVSNEILTGTHTPPPPPQPKKKKKKPKTGVPGHQDPNKSPQNTQNTPGKPKGPAKYPPNPNHPNPQHDKKPSQNPHQDPRSQPQPQKEKDYSESKSKPYSADFSHREKHKAGKNGESSNYNKYKRLQERYQVTEERFWSEPTFSGKKLEVVEEPLLAVINNPKMVKNMTLPPSHAWPEGWTTIKNGKRKLKPVPDELKPEQGVDKDVDFTYNPWDPETATGSISDMDIKLEAVDQKGDKPDVLPPTMKHGTDSVLFKNNVVQNVRDPRTGVYNFPQYVEQIVTTDKLDMDAISGFTPPDKDVTLARLAKETGAKYFGSTSTLTPLLSQFHNLLSNFRPAHLRNASKWITETNTKPTKVYRTPHVAEIHRRGDSFALGVDKVGDSESLLSKLGHSLEAFLTHTPEEYECLKLKPDMTMVTEEQIKEVRSKLPNTYAYSKISKFLTRSQLDCYDPRLPGTGTFDLKTRAVAGTRYDQVEAEMQHGTDYYVYRNVGQNESFERELFDMSRTVALKYSLQARIGRMDGIYVAFHNMKRFFGFQYFPLATLDVMNHTASMGQKENMLQDPKLWANEVAANGGIDLEEHNFEASKGVNTYSALVEDAVEKRASAIADKEFRLSMELSSMILDNTVGKMSTEEFDSHHQRMAFMADPSRAGRMIVCVGSHDPTEVKCSTAMSHKFHSRLLKTDMENRKIDGTFDYNNWPWKIDEDAQYDLPESERSKIAKRAIREMDKMDSRYKPEDLLRACREMWAISLKNLDVYELHIKNYVNHELVPIVADKAVHPSPTAETEWNVQYRFVKVSAPEEELRKMYIDMLERKLRVTLNTRGDLNEDEVVQTSEFQKWQQMFNKRGAEKLKEVDANAEKLGNAVSIHEGKRPWLQYSDKIEEVVEEEVIKEGKIVEEDVKVEVNA